MLMRALSATRTRKPLTAMSSAGGMRGVSGLGGGAPEKSWRQTAAPKEKALNRTRMVPTPPDHPVGNHPVQELLGADPAGERGQAGADPGCIGALGREHGAIGGQLGPSVGAVLLRHVIRHCATFRGIVQGITPEG